MLRNIFAALIISLIGALPLSAQQSRTWILVEAKATAAEAIDRIGVYEAIFPQVDGYELENGMFGVSVGPFSQLESEYLLGQFRRTGIIPPDSYVTTAEDFVRQFHPVVAEVNAGVIADTANDTKPDDEATALQVLPQETLREARAGEAQLSLEEKKELQIALQWAGFYASTIDGVFGRGTRGSMRRWQASKGFDETGILTTAQRAVLLGEYYAILDGLNMGLVTDNKAGISVEMPRAVVAFDAYTAPFAHYPSTDGSVAEIHLISRPGDRNTLYALFDVMQTLEIVPLEGRRKKNRNNIVITGRNDSIISHTEAYLDGGQIKGFTLVWPADKAEQADRLIDRMVTSFSTTSAVLPRGAGTELQPDQDMLAGLSVRTPSKIISGVFINSDGDILTSSAIDGTCAQIEVHGEMLYTLANHAPDLGISVLSPTSTVGPRDYARIRTAVPRIDSTSIVAGFSFGGTLNAPSLTRGTLAAASGLNGEAHLGRLSLEHFDADTGAAVLNSSGEMIGLLNAREDSDDRQLPSNVSFMTRADAIQTYLQDMKVAHSLSLTSTGNDAIDTERHARDIAVWISCWE